MTLPSPPPSPPTPTAGPALEVVEPGLATTVQDGGRPGLAHLGISPAGVVDLHLAAMVNRLVGNPLGAAVLETAGGLAVRATGALVVATTGATAPQVLRAGDEVVVAGGGGRVWHYLAVRGGVAVEPVLGSRSHDTLSGLGERSIRTGDRLPVGRAAVDSSVGDVVGDVVPIGPLSDTARICPGPRHAWFAADALERLTASAWTITATSRVGVRLRGVALERIVDAELPSEGLVRGAIQVPLDGDPVMMLADHPTTGGYPVIAVVVPDDVATVAQHPGGTRVRFRQ